MVNKCCVPGCTSNYRSRNRALPFVNTTVFRFPKEEDLRQKWLKKIPRDIVVTKNTVVCVKHFEEDDIILYKPSSGNPHAKKVLYRAPRLKPKAVPRIFPGLPEDLSKPKTAHQESPEKRARLSLELQQEQQVQSLQSDEIHSYNHLVTDIYNKLNLKYPDIHVQKRDTHLILLKFKNNDDEDMNPLVSFCVRIFKNMHIRLWVNNVELQYNQFKGLFSHTGKSLCLWSQLWEILNRYSKNIEELDLSSRSSDVAAVVEKLGEATGRQKTYTFIAEQLNLLCLAPSRYRYTTDTLILAFQLYHKSTACYMQLKELFCLPSVRALQVLSSNLHVGGSTNCVSFLKSKAVLSKPIERIVKVQLDELYVKPKVQYKGDRLYGNACNLVSVAEVMQSEQKLRINGLLKLHSISGELNVKIFIDKFSDIKVSKRDASFIAMFPMCDVAVLKPEDLPALLMVTGYIAKKTIIRLSCEGCKQKFGSRELHSLDLELNPKLLKYFNEVNTEGLTYPSNYLFNVIQCLYNVFNVCITKHEQEFLKVANQKQTLIGLFEKHITGIDYFREELFVCDVCKSELITNVMQSVSCFANILLKNYSVGKSESTTAVEVA